MKNPKISLIVAYGKNREIGKDLEMLWKLPDDFKWFKEHTENHPVIMGRKTMESMANKPLKNRSNIVVTSKEEVPEGFIKARSIKDALEIARSLNQGEIFIIGGGEIYRQSMSFVEKMYITEVDGDFRDANVFFPKFKKEDWANIYTKVNPKDEKHKYEFVFSILLKK